MNYYDVAVNFPKIQSILTYKSEVIFQEGELVEVPLGLGERREKGCIVGQKDSECYREEDEKFEIKEILGPIESLQIEHDLLRLLTWISHYYHYGLGKLIFDILPRALKRPRKLNSIHGDGRPLWFEPNRIQLEIIKNILDQIDVGHSFHLIHGVTGSGKTAIYLELIKKIMERGRSALFLLPEVNLTLQFLNLFQRHIDGPIYSYNSSLSNSDRFGLWKLLENDHHSKLILGTRSSIFLPVKNLGLVIIDEEHDASFKQDDRCTYHARNVAMKRAQILDVPIILGSATPATDTLKLFEEDKKNYHYHRMKTRISDAQLPEIQLIDIRGTEAEDSYITSWPIAPVAIKEMEKALARDEQILIFVNRLGYASYLQCRACGHQFFCQNCSVVLKYFKSKNHLKCQHCDYWETAPLECPKCYNLNLLQRGFGTERVEDVARKIFPDRTVKRFDRDELSTIDRVEERLNEFHEKKIDILVGTQMLSKGHNFKRVNFVLILGIDAQLCYPDFRAQEKVFQQICQTAGRAGRFGEQGRVVIQTFMPDAKIYTYIKNDNADAFYRAELSLRKEFHYPPYLKMAVIYLSSKCAKKVKEDSWELYHIFRSIRDQHFGKVEIYAPKACNVEKRANQFSWMLLLKSKSVNQLHNLIQSMNLNFRPSSSLRLDIDPINVL